MKPLMPLLAALLLALAAPAQTRPWEVAGVPRQVVLAPSQYRQALRPLVEWKRQCGFLVEELYVNENQRDSVRSRLVSLCDSLPAQFLLIVGGQQDIMPFPGQHTPQGLGVTLTDLPYADLDLDGQPDLLWGRLPARDTAELRAMTLKIIAYAQGRSLAPDRALLLAGYESREPAPRVTNGQVSRVAQLFSEAGVDTVTLYNPGTDTLPEEWEERRRDRVLTLLREGAAWVNYTGHSTYSGWRRPLVSYADIEALPPEGRFGVFVHNSCSGASASNYSFAAALLAQPAAGAAAVVGAVNETLWEEDYLWAAGSDSVQGMFSLLTAGELWLAGQMVEAGYQSVAQSGSEYTDFYRELYHLLGDPSMPLYVGQPQPLELQALAGLDTATLTLPLFGTPGAYVALAEQGELLAVSLLDSDGVGELLLPHPPTQPYCTLTAQKPGHQLLQDTLPVHGYQEPLTTDHSPLTTISVYPNPCSDVLHVSCETGPAPSLQIFDLQGRLVYQTTLNSQLSTLNLQSLPSGPYLLRLTTATTFHTQRLIISR